MFLHNAIYMLVRKRFFLFFIAGVLMLSSSAHGKAKDAPVKGVWVTCFSAKRVLYSMDAAFNLVRFCKKSGIDEIYLQIYRGGASYYDTKINDRAKYEEMLR